MTKVKIKTSNSKDPRRTTKLLEILSSQDVYLTRLLSVSDGFVAFTCLDEDLDKVFSSATEKLVECDYHPQMPPQPRALGQSSYLGWTVTFLKTLRLTFNLKLKKKNDWVGNINKIYKFPKGNIIKVTFEETNRAKKSTRTGLEGFLNEDP